MSVLLSNLEKCSSYPAGVGYLLKPASTLSFGQLDNAYVIDFEAVTADTSTLEMLIKGMASQSSKEVQDKFDS